MIEMEEVGAVVCKTCDPCSRNNKAKSGCYSCKNCNEYMCGECYGEHRHCSSSEEPRHSHPTERCSRHPSELLQMFCGKHDDVCCTVCIALDHKLVAFVFNINVNSLSRFFETAMSFIKICFNLGFSNQCIDF